MYSQTKKKTISRNNNKNSFTIEKDLSRLQLWKVNKWTETTYNIFGFADHILLN